MLEPPPGWMTGDTQTDWAYDPRFQPLLRVNASAASGSTAAAAGASSAASAIAARNYYRSLVPTAQRAAFDERIGIFWYDIGQGGIQTPYFAQLKRDGLNSDVYVNEWVEQDFRRPWNHVWMLQGAENLRGYVEGFLDAYDADLANNTTALPPLRVFINAEVRPFPFPSSGLVNNVRVLEAMFADPRASSAGSDGNGDGVGDNIIPMGSTTGKTLAQWRADADAAYSNVTFNIPFSSDPQTTQVDYRWIATTGPDSWLDPS